MTKTAGINIVGGPYLGGNFWASPGRTGFSQTVQDKDNNGIADIKYNGTNFTDYLPLVPVSNPQQHASPIENSNIDLINPGTDLTSPETDFTSSSTNITSSSKYLTNSSMNFTNSINYLTNPTTNSTNFSSDLTGTTTSKTAKTPDL